MWRDIKRIIHAHQNFLLTTHVNPDGDGIGAASAMIELLMQMGKNVRLVCDSPIPRKFKFLDYNSTFEVYNPEHDYSDVEVLIVLDTHKRDRIGALSDFIDRQKVTTICIDHHEVANPFTPHQAIDPKACSVGAMVYTLYKESGYELNLKAATGIYSSIVCDTGRFCYSSTSRKAHKIADECIKLGVDPDLIYSRLFQHVSLEEIKIFAKALDGMEMYLNSKVAIQQIRQADCEKMATRGENPEHIDLEHIDLEYIHDFNNLIEDVECFILLREISSQHVRVSLRSKSDLDISHLVRSLGGGGHANAAGLTWNGPIEEIKNQLLEKLELLFQNKQGSCLQL